MPVTSPADTAGITFLSSGTKFLFGQAVGNTAWTATIRMQPTSDVKNLTPASGEFFAQLRVQNVKRQTLQARHEVDRFDVNVMRHL